MNILSRSLESVRNSWHKTAGGWKVFFIIIGIVMCVVIALTLFVWLIVKALQLLAYRPPGMSASSNLYRVRRVRRW